MSNPNPPQLPPGTGRPKGVPNKATATAREAIAAFVEANTERLNGLLDGIEETKGPQAAFEAIMSVVEYHIPKLARTEMTGKDGGVLTVQIVKFDGEKS